MEINNINIPWRAAGEFRLERRKLECEACSRPPFRCMQHVLESSIFCLLTTGSSVASIKLATNHCLQSYRRKRAAGSCSHNTTHWQFSRWLHRSFRNQLLFVASADVSIKSVPSICSSSPTLHCRVHRKQFHLLEIQCWENIERPSWSKLSAIVDKLQCLIFNLVALGLFFGYSAKRNNGRSRWNWNEVDDSGEKLRHHASGLIRFITAHPTAQTF